VALLDDIDPLGDIFGCMLQIVHGFYCSSIIDT